MNRYMFERGNPIKYTDPDGHSPILVGAVAGFAIGTVGYGITHIGEGRGGFGNFAAYMGKGIGHGLIGAAAGAATAGVVFSAGGYVAASGGAAALPVAGKLAAIGASQYTLDTILDGENIDPVSLALSGTVNIIPSPFAPKPGTFYSMTHLTKNSYKFGADYLTGQGYEGLANLARNLLTGNNAAGESSVTIEQSTGFAYGTRGRRNISGSLIVTGSTGGQVAISPGLEKKMRNEGLI